MTKLTIVAVVLTGVAGLSSTALADSLAGPTYIGDRSANPEQETYAHSVTTTSPRLLAFIGPARQVGVILGNAEQNTMAYRPLLQAERNGALSWWVEQN